MSKKRALPFTGPGATAIQRIRWTKVPPIPDSVSVSKSPPWAPKYLQGTEILNSVSNPAWNKRKQRKAAARFAYTQGDIGNGAFSVTKQFATLTGGNPSFSVTDIVTDGKRTTTYSGLCVPSTGTIAFPPFAKSPKGSLDAWGTSAIAKCKPTNVFEDMSSSLAELAREGLPKLGVQAWKDVTKTAQNAAGGHLAVEFGFKPILGDIEKTLLARERTRTVIEQYIRDSGKSVRRRFVDPVQKSKTTTVKYDGGTSAMPTYLFSNSAIDAVFGTSGKTIFSRETEIRRWFSGAFTYHLPIDNLEVISADAFRDRGLISFDATPETIWNIAPWSWAVDWVLPVGDLIGNLQDWATDGLVMRYGYVMEHSIVRDTYTYTGKGSQHVGVLTLTSECKQRVQANPFGFGIDWNGLSPRQLAIVAALGISRGS